MFSRLVYQSFLRQRRRKLLALIAIALGTAVATATLIVASGVGDKISRELRSYGANIAVYPQEDSLDVRIGGVDLKPVSAGADPVQRERPQNKQKVWGQNKLGYYALLPGPTRGQAGG